MPKTVSTAEDRLYAALLKIGWPPERIQRQVPIGNGRFPGGVVLDFLIYDPAPLPVQVRGAYWHQDRAQDTFENVVIFKAFGRFPVTISDEELSTMEKAIDTALLRIGRPR